MVKGLKIKDILICHWCFNPNGNSASGGSATAANQVLEIAQLTAINANTDNLPAALGQTTMANSLPVVLASNQSSIPITVASLPLPSGAATETTSLAINTSLGNTGQIHTDLFTYIQSGGTGSTNLQMTTLRAQIPTTLGQKTMANSLAVVLASDQSSIPITVASLPLPSGAATSAKQDTTNNAIVTQSQSDTFGGVGNGATMTLNSKKTFSIQAVLSGGGVTFTGNLQVSNNGTNWFDLMTTAITEATLFVSLADTPALFARFTVGLIIGGTITTTIVAAN